MISLFDFCSRINEKLKITSIIKPVAGRLPANVMANLYMEYELERLDAVDSDLCWLRR